jgi:two-component system, OmpR family, sensor kinase
MSLRRRLSLWYGGLLAIVLAVAFSFGYEIHTASHDGDVDAALNDMASRATAEIESQLVAGRPLADVTLSALHRAIDEPHAAWLVADGAVVAAAGATDNTLMSAVDPVTAEDGWRSRWTVDGRARVLSVPVAAPGARLVLAADLRAVDASNKELLWTYLTLGLIAVAVGMGATFKVTASALRPLADITATANEIASSRDFARRVRVRGDPQDELVALGSTLDTMLAGLADAHDRQRRFLSDVSHELRTPLAVIHGNAELLAAGELDTDGQREAAAHTLRESERLTRLVDKLLLLARADTAEAFNGGPVQLDEIVLETVDEMRVVAGARLRVPWIDAVRVTGERDRLKQLLVLLVDNALRYTPAPGGVELSLVADGQQAVVRIEDEGIGLPSVPVARLFERSYRGPQAKAADPSGSGLGLAIARWIVDRHGGSIALEPNEPRGTRVIVRFPLGAATA